MSRPWSLERPSASRIARFLAEQRALPFTYEGVGATRDAGTSGGVPIPRGYAVDHNRQHLGHGEACFVAACAHLRAWRMFPPWTSIEPHAEVAIEEGRVLAVLVRAFGVWWLGSARIVYLIEEPRRFGFAYGTLPGHVESGEERFLVERLDDGAVWYDLRAFSRPRYWGARIAYPITRGLQRRFARDSKAAMSRALRG